MHASFRYLLPILNMGWLAAGCVRTDHAVPQFDASNVPSYGPVRFKDDAPANATVEAEHFPLKFIDADGKPVDLAQYQGKKKVVLVVLRGMARSERGRFCPSCLAQAVGLTTNASAFTQRGAVVLVVFPGPSERVGEFIQTVKSDSTSEPAGSFQLLLDRECRACDQLGIRDDLAKPSTYILDIRGRVVYAYVGETSTDRPSIKAVLAQLDRIR